VKSNVDTKFNQTEVEVSIQKPAIPYKKKDERLVIGKVPFFKKLKAALALGEELCS